MKIATLAVVLFSLVAPARASTDVELVALARRTVSLFECAALDNPQTMRGPHADLLAMGMVSGRALYNGIGDDYARMDRINAAFNKDAPHYALFESGTTADFKLGQLYGYISERLNEPFQKYLPDSPNLAFNGMTAAFQARNCGLIHK